ncbi:MAG: isoleucine--tRNA ligase, partial [Bacteroidales bacterium]|nr:isoleucine--tRNA ligase [Bacteroidales bacterium]
SLGPKYGKLMKQIAATINQFGQNEIDKIENEGRILLNINNKNVEILSDDVEILTEDIPGWCVANLNNLTVALDITITKSLKEEGIARELINRIQNLRKEKNFEVTDKIVIQIEKNNEIIDTIKNNFLYICSETLAESLNLVNEIESNEKVNIELTDNIKIFIKIDKI